MIAERDRLLIKDTRELYRKGAATDAKVRFIDEKFQRLKYVTPTQLDFRHDGATIRIRANSGADPTIDFYVPKTTLRSKIYVDNTDNFLKLQVGGVDTLTVTNARVGIGTEAPAVKLEIVTTDSEKLRLSDTAGSVYIRHLVNSSAEYYLDLVGAAPGLQISNNPFGPVDGFLHVKDSDVTTPADIGGIITIESASAASLGFLTDPTGTATIKIGDTSDTGIASISYAHSTDLFTLRAANTNIVFVNGTGLGVGASPTVKLMVQASAVTQAPTANTVALLEKSGAIDFTIQSDDTGPARIVFASASDDDDCTISFDPATGILTMAIHAVTVLQIQESDAGRFSVFGVTPALQQATVTDASTAHAITDPADTPVTADSLRDDLVANTIPSIESALNALGTKINSILASLEAFGFHATV